MKLGMYMYAPELSVSNTISILDNLGINRSRKAIYDWVQKADLQSDGGKIRIRLCWTKQ